MIAALLLFVLTLCIASHAQSVTLSSITSNTNRPTSTGSSSPAQSTSTSAASVTTSFSVSGTTSLPITITLNQTQTGSSVLYSSAVLASSTITAEYPSLSGYPICVTQCLQTSVAQTNCTSIIETSCYCGQQLFANAIAYCVANTCPDQLRSAENLAQKFCNVHSTISLSFPTPSTTLTTTQNGALKTGPSAIVTSSALMVFVACVGFIRLV